MGLFIFQRRLLELTGYIEDGNYKKMCLSIQSDNIQEQISIMEDALSNAKNNWTALTDNALSQALSNYNSTINGLNNNTQLNSLRDQLAKAGAAGTDTKAIQDQIDTINANINTKSQEAYAKYQNLQGIATRANQVTNSVFEEAHKRQLKALNDKDKAMKKKMVTLDGQVASWEKQRENTEKARDAAAEKEAVNFGNK